MQSAQLTLEMAVARLMEAGEAAKRVLSPCVVRIHMAEGAEKVSLLVDGHKVATFGPGHPVECADALYSFIIHLNTRVNAEA
jgi:hypothetical protein